MSMSVPPPNCDDHSRVFGRTRARVERLGDRFHFSRRETLITLLPVMLMLALVGYVAQRFVRPAPPTTVVMTVGNRGGPYEAFAERYRAEAPQIETIAGVYYEPVWLFSRDTDTLARLSDLAGKRIKASLHIVSLAQSEAVARHFPTLTPLVLPQGAVVDRAVNALKIPLAFYHEVHLLRAHIAMVRDRLVDHGEAPSGVPVRPAASAGSVTEATGATVVAGGASATSGPVARADGQAATTPVGPFPA